MSLQPIRKDLSELNTLGVTAMAEQYAEIQNETQLLEVVEFAKASNKEIRVLGGGSNLILRPELTYLVVNSIAKGISIVSEDHHFAVVSASAGEVWSDFVDWAVRNNLSGIENLALIPGNVGASPVQNIGAYGVEVGDVIESVKAYDFESNQWLSFSQVQCDFGYRNSIFKKHENRYFISEVVLKLSKHFDPVLNYGPLAALKAKSDLSLADVFKEVVSIRTAKLPDPAVLPNAGSFFKNPIVDREQREEILNSFPDLVSFEYGSKYKLAAGWLIDQAGLKGRSGPDGVGCYSKQALVLVNPTRADAESVLRWSDYVKQQVKLKFGVELEIEPRIW
jgi:UDP-N-acetylmuramate dehydrogenase